MRNVYSVFAAALFFLMLLLPLIARQGEEAAPPKKEESNSFRVKIGEEIKTFTAEEYITGVVAAEMPALYNEEALKAQAVAAYTYAENKRRRSGGEYDITADSATDQAFIETAAMKEKWGENYEEYYGKIKAAVKAVEGELILYEGEPIFAAYHAISAGRTESAANVWGGDYPYLVAVESVSDKLSKGYKSEVLVSKAEFLEKTGGDTVNETIRSESGTVLSIKIGEKEFKGSEIRKLFSLRSSNFEISLSGEEYRFTVYGYGHGVGLSQQGANYLAGQGFDYREILLWYYKGCEIK